MADKVFIDTNVLVYAYDTHDIAKQARAQAVVTDAMSNETGVVSTQVLGEFFCVVTRRIPAPLDNDQARAIINDLSVMDIVEIDLPMINRAIELLGKHQLSYWDALIVSAAERAGCTKLLSEDLQTGQMLAGVRVVNPFAA